MNDCLQNQLVETGGQFGDNFDPIIAQNLFVIDLHDPAIAALLARLRIKANRVVIKIRAFAKLYISCRNKRFP